MTPKSLDPENPVTALDLGSTFGCFEMEAAAAVLVNKGRGAVVHPDDFLEGENHEALDGFVMLVAYGWVKTEDIEFGNGAFRAEPAFWKRLEKKGKVPRL